MPNSKSAKKALRKSESRRLRNRMQMSTLRTAVKRCRVAAASDDSAAAAAEFSKAAKILDKAAAKNLIHKNKAARTKSRLSKLVGGSSAS